MMDRGLEVSHETIRAWIQDFGPLYAQSIRKSRGVSESDGTLMRCA